MPTRNIIAMLATLGMTLIFVIVLVLSGHLAVDSGPTVATILGFASLIIVNVLNSPHSQIKGVENKVDKVLNGVMDKKIVDGTKAGVSEVLDDRGLTSETVASIVDPAPPTNDTH